MYYKLNFDVVSWQRFSLTELEEMLPYERDMYVQWLHEEKLEKEQEARN